MERPQPSGNMGRPKSKKKKSFLRTAKRNAKKGLFGKGLQISEDKFKYYSRVYGLMKQVKGAERGLLLQNFFREYMKEEDANKLVCNQVLSHILEYALHNADASQVLELADVFGKDIRILCVDQCASHVMQTLLVVAFKYAQEDAKETKFEQHDSEDGIVEKSIPVSEATQQKLTNFLMKVCRFVSNNLDDFIWDKYASHVICSVLMVCSGVDVEDTIKSKALNKHGLIKKDQLLKVPDELQPLLQDLTMKFTMLQNITGIITNNCSSVVAQTLLLVLASKEKELFEKVVNHLLEHGFRNVTVTPYTNYLKQAESNLHPVFQSNAAIHLLQILISGSSSETQKEVYVEYFKGNIPKLVVDHQANFAVQSLLSAWSDKDDFQDLFEETSASLEAAISVKNLGILHAFTQAFCRFSKQHVGMQALKELLDCSKEERWNDFAPLVLGLVKYDDFQKRQSEGSALQICLHGALILQELLSCNKPSQIVQSLIEMSIDDLLLIACHEQGSHVFTSYFSSNFVGSRNWEKMIKKFQGKFTELACCKYGSRSLENMWKAANISMKTLICNELVKDGLKIKENLYGKFIHSNFMLSMFGRNNHLDWQQLITAEEKKRKKFDDLIKDADKVLNKAKKKKVEGNM